MHNKSFIASFFGKKYFCRQKLYLPQQKATFATLDLTAEKVFTTNWQKLANRDRS